MSAKIWDHISFYTLQLNPKQFNECLMDYFNWYLTIKDYFEFKLATYHLIVHYGFIFYKESFPWILNVIENETEEINWIKYILLIEYICERKLMKKSEIKYWKYIKKVTKIYLKLQSTFSISKGEKESLFKATKQYAKYLKENKPIFYDMLHKHLTRICELTCGEYVNTHTLKYVLRNLLLEIGNDNEKI